MVMENQKSTKNLWNNLKLDILIYGFKDNYCIILNGSKKTLICKGFVVSEVMDRFLCQLEEDFFPENLEALWLDFLADDHGILHEDDDRGILLDNFLFQIENWMFEQAVELLTKEKENDI